MATREQMLAARDRRMTRFNTRLEWYGRRVFGNIQLGMHQRLRIAGQLLRDGIVINISIPVVKQKSARTGRIVVTERSRPGEFPRADTTRLMKDVFSELRVEEDLCRVGTTLDYGLWLEIRMHRSFLRRTLLEIGPQLATILTTVYGGSRPLPGQDA